MSYHLLSERYERDYVLFTNVESDFEHASINAIQATHLIHDFHNQLELRCSTTHFTTAKMALDLV